MNPTTQIGVRPETPSIDKWSTLHALGGASLAALGVSRPVAYGLFMAVELGELLLSSFGSEFFNESRRNIIADLIIDVVAYELTLAVQDL